MIWVVFVLFGADMFNKLKLVPGSSSFNTILKLQTANILSSSQFPFMFFSLSFLSLEDVPDPALDVALEEFHQRSDDPSPVPSVGPLVVHLGRSVGLHIPQLPAAVDAL